MRFQNSGGNFFPVQNSEISESIERTRLAYIRCLPGISNPSVLYIRRPKGIEGLFLGFFGLIGDERLLQREKSFVLGINALVVLQD